MAQHAWSVADIPDQTGQLVVVTGANSGIGFETVRALAARGAHVVLAVRSPERGQAAGAAIRAATPRASLEVMALDLANLASVHRFAAGFLARFDALPLLVNNAGVASPSLQRTADGFELLFGTNHLGHFALTGLLLPAILVAPGARVATVASMAHRNGRIDFDHLDGPKGYQGNRAYAQSKLANLLFAYELQRRLAAAGAHAISVACHPGWAVTKMTAGPPGPTPRVSDRLFSLLTRLFAPSAADGAQPILYAATARDVMGGAYIGPSGRFGAWGQPGPVRSSDRSHDQNLAHHLWQVSERLTGVRYSMLNEQEALPPLTPRSERAGGS